MKTIGTLEQKNENIKNETSTEVLKLEFADVVVYNEMADQTSIKLNLIEQIHSQLDQLDEMVHKKRYMMKEVLQYIAD